MESLKVMNLEGFGINLDHPALWDSWCTISLYSGCVEGEARKPYPNRRIQARCSFDFGPSHSKELRGF